jgi:NAD(P)-dependent dehydrogenase (short-subunit alcohol dehydrogenase family)
MTSPTKTAIVTGAGRGIGSEIARVLAMRGFAVLAAARTVTELEDLCSDLREQGCIATPVRCDVRSLDDVRALIQACECEHGRLDVLVNNAGVGRILPVAETTDAIWRETVETNLSGTFYCTREALPLMLRTGGGVIVNMASIAAVRGFANFAAYAACKAGILAFSRSLREEVRKRGIRVTVVMPGATQSSFWEGQQGDWDPRRMIPAREVAEAVAHAVCQPPSTSTDEIVIMPSGGPL